MAAPLVFALIPVVEAACRAAQAQSQTEIQFSQQQLELEVARAQASVEIARIDAQKEVMQDMIQAAKEIKLQRTQGFISIVHRAQDMLQEHQAALVSELESLTKKQMTEDISDREDSYISLRKTEIDNALSEIDNLSFQLSQASQVLVQF